MKKQKASLLTAAMLLTMAWMTGCDSEQQESSSERSVVETTALTVVTEATEEASERQTDAAVSAGQDAQTEGASNLEFDSYDAFLEAMGEYYPGVVLVAPPQIVSGEWEVTKIQLLVSGEQPFYDYAVTTPEGNNLLLTVSSETQFQSIDDLKAQMQPDSVTIQEGYSGSNWVIGKVAEPEMYTLYGFTGDESVYYALIGADSAGNSLGPDALQELHDKMLL